MNDQLTTELSDRLITLPDGRPGLRGTLQVEIKDPSVECQVSREPSPLTPLPTGLGEGNLAAGRAVLDFISSDETLDRYGEIIVASGWRLENYRRNPVFQNAHQYGDVIFTLGRALITEIRTRQPSTTNSQPSTTNSQPSTFLFQRIEFATEVNPMARIAYGLYKGKFLNAVSVGFIPLRWVNGSGKGEVLGDERGEVRGEKEAKSDHSLFGVHPLGCSDVQVPNKDTLKGGHQTGTDFRRKYIEQELLEVSAVGIPANPNALALGLKSGAIEKGDLRDLHDLIRQTLGDTKEEGNWEEVPIKVKRQTKKEKELAELLRLAREVRDILKA